MWSRIVYTKNAGRRPVWLGCRPVPRDVQGDIPVGWCSCCGKEVYVSGKLQCRQCDERSERKWKDKNTDPAPA